MTFPLAVILGYTAVLMALGLYLGRRVHAGADFFVAGRTLGPGLLFATLLASNIGAGSTVGATGLGYRDGLAAWWWVGAAALGSMIQALWIGPKLRDIAATHNLQTVGDYLEFRYDRRVRTVIAVLLWVGSLAIFAGQLMGLAVILGPVAGAPKWLACVIGGALVTGYFSVGGLHGTVRINVVQLTVKLVGLFLALMVGFAMVGGLSAVSNMPAPSPTYWSLWASGDSGWGYLALLTPAFIVSPGLLQKVYAARDSRAVRWGVGLNAAALFLYAGVPALLGILARARFPDLPMHELALPTLLSAGLPPLVGAIGLAAVFSAEVSAADASLFMLTTSLGRDLYKRTIAPEASDRSVVKVTKAAAVVAGVIGTVLAIVLPTVVAALSIFYALLGVGLLVPILAGLYVRGASAAEALSSIVAGVTTMLVVNWVTSGRGWANLTPPWLGLMAAVLAFAIVFTIRTTQAQRSPRASA